MAPEVTTLSPSCMSRYQNITYLALMALDAVSFISEL
jgi:hypothetical protein